MLPTALAFNEGAEFRAGMAWVLIGGFLRKKLKKDLVTGPPLSH